MPEVWRRSQVSHARAIPEDQLTPYFSFAPEVRDAGETEDPSTWDDIDDYNGYVKQISTPHVENYSVMTTVDYVSASNPDITSLTQTYFKRITEIYSFEFPL